MKAWQREHDLNALQAMANLIAALLRQAELAAEYCGEAEIECAQACAALDAALLRQLAARDGSERAATELSARLRAAEAELGEWLYLASLEAGSRLRLQRAAICELQALKLHIDDYLLFRDAPRLGERVGALARATDRLQRQRGANAAFQAHARAAGQSLRAALQALDGAAEPQNDDREPNQRQRA